MQSIEEKRRQLAERLQAQEPTQQLEEGMAPREAVAGQQQFAPIQYAPIQGAPQPQAGVEGGAYYAHEFNRGLSNLLGFPADLFDVGMKAAGIMSPETNSVLSSTWIRQQLRNTEMLGLTEEEPVRGVGGRAARIAGETALPLGGLMAYGARTATTQMAVPQMSVLQNLSYQAYSKPLATMTGETLAVTGAAIGGEAAKDLFPDYGNAELLGELGGGLSPSVLLSTGRLISQNAPLLGRGIQWGKELFSKSGAERRATTRISGTVADVEKAKTVLAQQTILGLDPMTQVGDPVLLSLRQSAIAKDVQLAERTRVATENAMDIARKNIAGTGSPEATAEFLSLARQRAAAEAQTKINALGGDIDPVQTSRIIRNSIENSYASARKVENEIWGALPKKGTVELDNTVDTFENILRSRAFTEDPDDIPNYLYGFVGRMKKNKETGTVEFSRGALLKRPELGNVQGLRSRIGADIRAELGKDVPNRNKVRILKEVQNSLDDALYSVSDDYASAVDYSRELNKAFTQGRVGQMLGYERTGGLSVTPEGTFEFIVSGNKDDARKALQQLREGNPQVMPMIEENLKGMFNAAVIDKDGALNVDHARRFLASKSHILDEFPVIKQGVEDSIKQQRAVDVMFGARAGGETSTFAKQKSVTSLYLDGDPDTAMKRIISARNNEAQGAQMRELVVRVKEDPTEEALQGLKSAYGQYLLRHAVDGQTDFISGRKFNRLFEATQPAAKELFSPEELVRMKTIGNELTKVNRALAAPRGGAVISDAPNKIIRVIGGTYAARAGATVGKGTSGASLRTASIFTKEFNEVLGRLTNDGAEALILKAVEDPVVLQSLLKTPSQVNLLEGNQLWKRVLPADAFLGGQMAFPPDQSRNGEDLSIEEKRQKLRQRLNIQ